MGLSEPRLDSSLLDETVAFQTQKMSANRVIGELERGCQLIHGFVRVPAAAEEFDPACFPAIALANLRPSLRNGTVRGKQVKAVGAAVSAAFPFLGHSAFGLPCSAFDVCFLRSPLCFLLGA